MNELIATGRYGRLFAVVHFASHQWKVTSEDLILIENELDIACGERIRLEKVRLSVFWCIRGSVTKCAIPAPGPSTERFPQIRSDCRQKRGMGERVVNRAGRRRARACLQGRPHSGFTPHRGQPALSRTISHLVNLFPQEKTPSQIQ